MTILMKVLMTILMTNINDGGSCFLKSIIPDGVFYRARLTPLQKNSVRPLRAVLVDLATKSKW